MKESSFSNYAGIGASLGLHLALGAVVLVYSFHQAPVEEVFEVTLIHLGDLSDESKDGGKKNASQELVTTKASQEILKQVAPVKKDHQEIKLAENFKKIAASSDRKETPKKNSSEAHAEGKESSSAQVSSTRGEARANEGNLGTGLGFGKAKATYTQLVLARLEQEKRYPRSAKRMHAQGVATLELVLRENGKLLSSRLVHSSGFHILDTEVQSLAKRAAPYPKMPEKLQKNSIVLHVPVEFRLMS